MPRIEVHDGDAVTRADVIAVLHPTPLDPRERQEATARVDGDQALEREAQERTVHTRADHEQARRDQERAKQLANNKIIRHPGAVGRAYAGGR